MPLFPSRLAAKLLALFLLILGAKFCVMRACSSPLPFFDQWNGEGTDLLQPWVHGSWHWTSLFAFHVQHRIALTRLLVLGLFQANGGQWDTQVEMIAAAVFHALAAVVLGAVLARRLGPAAEDKLIGGLALLFMLPFGWENTLSGGFQSQFYFLLGLSFVTLWGLGTQPPGAAGWWTGVAAAVLAWFSMGSAPLAPLAVAAALALRWWRPTGAAARPRGDWIALGTALGLFAVGTCVMLGSDPNANLQPRSPGAFLLKFLGLLGWPNPTALAAPLAYAPWACLLARRLLTPGRPRGRAEEFLLALGTFTVLQTAAIAFGRNQYRGLIVSRYMDVLSIGAFVNFACLLQWAGETRTARERAWLRAAGAGWLGLLACGLSPLTIHDLNGELPFMRACNAQEDANVAALIAHADPALLKDKNAFDFQCQDPRLMMKLVQDPLMAGAWPVHARRPRTLTPVAAAGRLSALTEDTPTAAVPVPPPVGWTLLPPPAGERATTFRSQTLAGGLPYLVFAARGEVGPSVRLALVGERTGRTRWVLPPEKTARGAWWTAPVAVPPGEPFHVEATVGADGAAAGGLAFLFPREMGRLSAWVDPLLGSAVGWLLAGVALWLAAGLVGAEGGGNLRGSGFVGRAHRRPLDGAWSGRKEERVQAAVGA